VFVQEQVKNRRQLLVNCEVLSISERVAVDISVVLCSVTRTFWK